MYYAKEAKLSTDNIVKQNENERYTMIWEELVIGKYNIENEIRDKVSQGLYEFTIIIPIYTKYGRYDDNFHGYGDVVDVYLNPSKSGYVLSDLTSCLRLFGYSTQGYINSVDHDIKIVIGW